MAAQLEGSGRLPFLRCPSIFTGAHHRPQQTPLSHPGHGCWFDPAALVGGRNTAHAGTGKRLVGTFSGRVSFHKEQKARRKVRGYPLSFSGYLLFFRSQPPRRRHFIFIPHFLRHYRPVMITFSDNCGIIKRIRTPHNTIISDWSIIDGADYLNPFLQRRNRQI